MNNTLRICPIFIEEFWTNPEKKELSIIPINNWGFEKEVGNVRWSFFEVVEEGVFKGKKLFINQSTRMFAFEKNLEEDFLEFFLYLSYYKEITFIIDIFSLWKLEYISEGTVCNRSQRLLRPVGKVADFWITQGNRTNYIPKISPQEKDKIINCNGIWKYTFLPTGDEVLFDIEIDTSFSYSISITFGVPEKTDPNTPLHKILKKMILLELLLSPSKILWKKHAKQLSKK